MVEYYKELDEKFYLPVVTHPNHIHDNEKMPKDFYYKYEKLFQFINNFNINEKSLDLSNFDIEVYNILRKKLTFISKIKNTSIYELSVIDLEKYLVFYGEIIDSFYNLGLYNVEHKDFIKTMLLFNDSLIDIAEVREKFIKHYLPNTWFITSNGYLYNTRSSDHFSADFANYYKEKKKEFLDNKLFIKQEEPSINKIKIFTKEDEPKSINKNKYVRAFVLDTFLHYSNYIIFNNKVYDPRFLKIISGMMELKTDYINFLKRLSNLCSDPVKELEKISSLTGDNYDDVLIRCCGASKIVRQKSDIIVTSCLNYEYEFYEYIKRGWDIAFYPPIIINESKGIVEEYYPESIKIKQILKNYRSRDY